MIDHVGKGGDRYLALDVAESLAPVGVHADHGRDPGEPVAPEVAQ